MNFREKIAALEGNTLCIGIDPDPITLETHGFDLSADGALDFGIRVLNAVDLAGVKIVKPQIAFFEQYGMSGFAALEQVIAEARRRNLLVIADAKRGDIGSTMAGYANAWLGHSSISADALTVSPFLGFDSLTPAFDKAKNMEKGVFVLGITSNPEGFLVQGSINSEGSVAKALVTRAKALSDASGCVGLVIGASADLVRYGLNSDSFSGIPILAPGVGAQGGTFEQLHKVFGGNTKLVIPNISRGIFSDGLSKIYESVSNFVDEWRTINRT